jgi:chorismate mutase
MSHSSHASNLAVYREALEQLNTHFFLLICERRNIAMKIQESKDAPGRFPHFDPERERELFTKIQSDLKELSIKELLAFSLIMEDQAMAMAPGAYPAWSQGAHLAVATGELFTLINPLLLKFTHPEIFLRLNLSADFSFLKDL